MCECFVFFIHQAQERTNPHRLHPTPLSLLYLARPYHPVCLPSIKQDGQEAHESPALLTLPMHPLHYLTAPSHPSQPLRTPPLTPQKSFYIHAPIAASTLPLATQLSQLNAAHASGLFTRFGLSNFSAAQVREVHAHCTAHAYVLPTVYQGNYNPVARKAESLLFPTLRFLNMSFYAYSPLAGGFLAKSKSDIEEGKGRFDQSTFLGKMYGKLYSRPTFLEALGEWEDIAREEGCTRAELAYRWVAFNSPLKREFGDGIVVGARDVGQLEQTLGGMERGALSETACARIEGVWRRVEAEAPTDNWEIMQEMQS